MGMGCFWIMLLSLAIVLFSWFIVYFRAIRLIGKLCQRALVWDKDSVEC